MLRHRLTLGPALIALLVLGVWIDQLIDYAPVPATLGFLAEGDGTWPPGVLVFGVVVLICSVTAREIAAILRAGGILASARGCALAGIAGLLPMAFISDGVPVTTALALFASTAGGTLAAALLVASHKQNVKGVIAAAGGAMLSYAYLGVLLGFLVAIRREHSAWVLLWVLAVTKSCDIGAFFTGSAIGKNKLIVWLSPKKTWEGLIGGMLTSAVVAVIGHFAFAQWGSESLPPVWTSAIAGLLFGLIGQGGDLAASLLKRDAGIKDSGSILPGFGGALDVIDSPAMVAPVAFWWLHLLW